MPKAYDRQSIHSHYYKKQTSPLKSLAGVFDPSGFQEVNKENLRLLAMYLLGCQLTHALNTMQNVHSCTKPSQLRNMKLPLKIFSWDLEYCLQRRQENLIWLQFFVKSFSRDCIESKKYITNLGEVIRLLQLMLQISLRRPSLMDSELVDTFDALTQAEEYLKYEEHLKGILNENIDFFDDEKGRILAIDFLKCSLNATKRSIAESKEESRMLLAIEFRYRRENIQVNEECCIYKLENEIATLKEKILEWNDKIDREKFYIANVKSLLFADTDKIAKKVRYWEEKYETDFEHIEVKSMKLRKMIEKMIDTKMACREKIEGYKQWIREWEIREQWEAERLLRAQEYVVPEKIMKRLKKKNEKLLKKQNYTIKS